MTSTLITGGAGFIGSRLAARLLTAGESVVVLDNFNSYYDPAIKRANIAALDALGGDLTVIEGDIRDEALVSRIHGEHEIRAVAHLAAMAGLRASPEQGRLYTDVNTTGSVVLMDEAHKRGVEVFVLGSTSSVYGATTQIPFVETDTATEPLAPYPASKRAAELLAYTYHHLFGLNVNVLRFFNVYGPHGRPDMMPLKTIEAILKGETITLFDGGSIQRDWTYVDDIVSGVAAALKRPMGYEIMNLGVGAPIPLNEFVSIYEGLIGKKAITKSVPAPKTDAPITYCDNAKARRLLDFNPTTPVADGLAATWAWYRRQFGV